MALRYNISINSHCTTSIVAAQCCLQAEIKINKLLIPDANNTIWAQMHLKPNININLSGILSLVLENIRYLGSSAGSRKQHYFKIQDGNSWDVKFRKMLFNHCFPTPIPASPGSVFMHAFLSWLQIFLKCFWNTVHNHTSNIISILRTNIYPEICAKSI